MSRPSDLQILGVSVGIWVVGIIILAIYTLPKILSPITSGAGPQPTSQGGGSGA